MSYSGVMTRRTRDSSSVFETPEKNCGPTVDFEGKFIAVVSGQIPAEVISPTHVLSSVFG